MPEIVYSFKYKNFTNVNKQTIYNFKHKSLTNFPKNIFYSFNYYFLVFRDYASKFLSINFLKEREQILKFKYNLGKQKIYLYQQMSGNIKSNLLYKSSIVGKINYTKHFDMEFYAIPLMIELFDLQITVNPPETILYDILLGGYLDTEDEYDPNTARSGISGEDGFITSQGSPVIKYSSIAYNFKSAKKYPLPLTWGIEAKPVYQKRSLRVLTDNWYYLIINKDKTKSIYDVVNVERIYVNYRFIDNFLDGLTDDIKQNLSFQFKNGAIINDLSQITSLSFISKEHHLYFIKDVLEMDIISKRFDLENSRWVIIYFDDNTSTYKYDCKWI